MRGRLSERRLSQSGIRNLDPKAREILAEARKKDPTQRHFQDSNWWMWKGSQHDGHLAPAASGAREDGNPRATLLNDLLAHANPCPTSSEWFR